MKSHWIVLLAVLAANLASAAPLNFDTPAQRQRYNELIVELRCLVCQNQSLANSPAPLARELRQEVLTMMKSGKSNDEIRVYLVQRYGEYVLYQPRVTPGTWALWFGPLLLVVLGAAVLWTALKKRHANAETKEVKD